MTPPAPAWFSMITGWPRIACRRAVTSRDTASVDPPGGTGTTSLMVRSGKVCATAGQQAAAATAAAATHRNRDLDIWRFPRMPAILRRPGSRQQRAGIVGWVSEAKPNAGHTRTMGFASLNPSYMLGIPPEISMDSDRNEGDLMSRRTVMGAAAATMVSGDAAAQVAAPGAPRAKGTRVWLDMDQKEL